MKSSTPQTGQDFGTLLIALLLLFVGYGLLDYADGNLNIIVLSAANYLLLTFVLVTAVVNVTRERKSAEVRAVWFLLVATILVGFVDMRLDQRELHWLGLILIMCCVGHTLRIVLGYLFRAREVTLDTLNASMCAFLLLGFFWALWYALVHAIEPASFQSTTLGPGEAGFGTRQMVPELYYSIVTMTTLGYGDIIPLSTTARISAALEAVTGQVFLVVLVARLVGLNVARSANG